MEQCSNSRASHRSRLATTPLTKRKLNNNCLELRARVVIRNMVWQTTKLPSLQARPPVITETVKCRINMDSRIWLTRATCRPASNNNGWGPTLVPKAATRWQPTNNNNSRSYKRKGKPCQKVLVKCSENGKCRKWGEAITQAATRNNKWIIWDNTRGIEQWSRRALDDTYTTSLIIFLTTISIHPLPISLTYQSITITWSPNLTTLRF